MEINKIKKLLNSKKYLQRIDGYAYLFDKSKAVQRKHLVEGVKDKHSQVRGEVANYMGQANDDFYVPYLLDLLHDKVDIVRFKAVDALGYYPKKKRATEDHILKLLNDKNSTVRVCAASTAGDIKSKKALLKLKKIATSDDNYVARVVAIRSIGFLEDKGNVKWLELRLKGAKKELKSTIYAALIACNHDDYYWDLVELIDDQSSQVRLVTINNFINTVSYYIDPKEVLKLLQNRKKKEKNKKCLEALNRGIKEIKETV